MLLWGDIQRRGEDRRMCQKQSTPYLGVWEECRGVGWGGGRCSPGFQN